MKLAWARGAYRGSAYHNRSRGCGMSTSLLILGLLCCVAEARNTAGSDAAGRASVLLRSDPPDPSDAELPSDEGTPNQRWEGKKKDYNRETTVIWLKESGLPMTVEFIIAFSWIAMVASMPLIVLVLEGGSITRVQIINFTVMWLVLTGGIWLFHKVLLFQSSHFEYHRSLTLVECVYLMSQILTTVGYGDITPANQMGQVFVALYVMVSLLIIANVASEAAGAIEKRTTAITRELQKQVHSQIVPRVRRVFTPNQPTEVTTTRGEDIRRMWSSSFDLPPLPWPRLLRSIIVYVTFCAMGSIFYLNYPGENKTLLDTVYMSVITLSTVGFGAVTPQTEGGKVFGSFWIFFGTAALFKLVGDFMELVVVMKQREMWDGEEELKKCVERVQVLPTELSAHDFFKFSLVQRGHLQQKDVDMLGRAFELLDPDGDGTISKEEARRFLDFGD